MRRSVTGALLAALTLTGVVGCSGGAVDEPEAQDSPRQTQTSEAVDEPSNEPTPTPTPTRVPGTYMLGETSEDFAGGVITLNSIEVVTEVATTDGSPITAADGEQLVVFHTHFVNTGPNTVDLTCAGVPNWYITVWDTEQRELAPVFEGYRLPGNPECNHQMLSGQEADWTFVFRGIAGSTPRSMQIEDSRTFDDWIAFALTDEPLRLAED